MLLVKQLLGPSEVIKMPMIQVLFKNHLSQSVPSHKIATGMLTEIKRWENKLEGRALKKIIQTSDRKTKFGQRKCHPKA